MVLIMTNKANEGRQFSEIYGLGVVAGIVAVVAVLITLSGCGPHEKNNVIYMDDMVYSPAYKAQKEGAMRMPVKGTIPRGFEPYAYANDAEAAGRELRNPLRRTAAVLGRGQALFNTYCIVCHGPNGMGDGYIVPKFPRPPSLQSDKVRGWPDGRIYHVVSMGQNLMPSYASQIAPGDRWAIIHYVRALQKSQHPSAEDLKVAKEESN
jgi:mono/diheme cytochrome c family protein